MQFGVLQNVQFGSPAGTYSQVTKREVYDSQITLTDYEAELAIEQFGDTIFRGPVRNNPEQAKKPFRLHATGEIIYLNLVYPKPLKNELRLYIGKRAGFKPDAGDIWFMYRKGGEFFIGAMSEMEWRGQERVDFEDLDYQSSIYKEAEIRRTQIAARGAWGRNPQLAKQCLERTGFRCEFDHSHSLFVSRATLRPYVEAHHLIPMQFQDVLKMPLDHEANIFSLCPVCHSKIHHAINTDVSAVVCSLYESRGARFGEQFNLSLDEVLRLYNCEDICR